MAQTRDGADEYLRLTKLGVVAGVYDITHEGQLAAAAQLSHQAFNSLNNIALRISWRMSYGISIDGSDGRLHRSRDSIPMDRKLPAKHCANVLSTISLISAPAIRSTVRQTMVSKEMANDMKSTDRRMPSHFRSKRWQRWLCRTRTLSMAFDTSLMSPSHKAFRAFGRFS